MAESREQPIFEQHPSASNAVHQFQMVVKRGRWKKLHFTYSFLPIYYFSRILGLIPYSFICDSEGELQAPRINLIDGIWFLLSICIYLLAAFTNYQTIALPKEMKIASALYFGHYALLILGLVISAISIAMDMWNRNKLVAILKAFNEFDKEVSEPTCYKSISNMCIYFEIKFQFYRWRMPAFILIIVKSFVVHCSIYALQSPFACFSCGQHFFSVILLWTVFQHLVCGTILVHIYSRTL